MVPEAKSGEMSTALKGAPLTTFNPTNWFRVTSTGIPCA
jgi:hypothetical protein